MPFGALSSAQQIMVRLYLLGGPKYRAELEKAGISTRGLGKAHVDLGKALHATNKQTFLHNQLLFSARRSLFYASIGTVALAAATARLGFSYLNTLEQTQVALKPVFAGNKQLEKQISGLFTLSALTPFSFQQITEAFRLMYTGFQPLGISVETINNTLAKTIDIMSFMGNLTPASLKRVSLALQDMANVGYVTGVSVFQLARNGIPMRNILQKELKLTGDQMDRIGELRIPVQTALDAITSYATKTPGIMGAASRQASETLYGAWSTFRDLLSQAAGQAESGIFGFLRRTLQGINSELARTFEAGKPVTFDALINAIDNQLTPATHGIRNAFALLEGMIQGIAGTFYVLGKTVSTILTPFNMLLEFLNIGTSSFKIIGVAIGVLTGLLIAGGSVWIAYRVAVNGAAAAQFLLGNAIKTTIIMQRAQLLLLGGSAGAGLIGRWKEWSTAMETVSRTPAWKSKSGGLEIERELKNQGRIADLSRKMFDKFSVGGGGGGGGVLGKFKNAIKGIGVEFKTGGFKAGLVATRTALLSMIPAFIGAASAAWGFTAALLANPITWIVIGVVAAVAALVILYRKWDWFHYAVNDALRFMRENWELFVAAIPFVGPLIVIGIKLVGVFRELAGWIHSVVDWLGKMIDKINIIPDPRNIPVLGWILKHPGPSITDVVGMGGKAAKWLVTEDIEKRAGGGGIFRTGPVLVGEQGPELVNLPGGASVIPSDRLRGARVDPIGLGRDRRDGDSDGRPVIVQVMLDRKVLAEGVARANQDYAARR